MNIEQTLVHAVTEFDRKQSTKRGWNPHALGIYLERVECVCADIAGGAEPRQAIMTGFNDRLLDHCLRACGFPTASVEEHKHGPLTYAPKSEGA